MDVAKAKTIVIILLLAFNVFLLVNNLMHYDSQSVSKSMLENTETILKQRGVTLECEIPSTPGEGYRLVYIAGGLEREGTAQKLLGEGYQKSPDGNVMSQDGRKIEFDGDTRFIYTDEAASAPKENVSEKEAREAALRFLKDKGLLDGSYVPDGAAQKDDGSWILDYIESYNGSLLYDNCFTVTVRGKTVTSLVYQKQQIKGFSSNGIERIEAYQALLARFKEGSDVVITSIDSGYKLDESRMDEMESVELLPVWRVKIKGGSEPIYIRSHDG